MFASVLLIYIVLIDSSNKSEAFDQQPLLSLHKRCGSTSRKSDYQHNQGRPTFCPPFFMSITHITLWPASSSGYCHSTHEPNCCIWGYFQFKVSFSTGHQFNTSAISVSYRTIQWDFLTQAGTGCMSWQTKSDSMQPSTKLSRRYPKANNQQSLDLNLGEMIAIF